MLQQRASQAQAGSRPSGWLRKGPSCGRARAVRVNVQAAAQQASSLAGELPGFIPTSLAQKINDPDFHAMARQMRRVPVKLNSLPQESLRTAVVGPTGAALDNLGLGSDDPVLVLLHSFDSSSLEWRRVYPQLTQSLDMPVVALDLVGWGFTDHAAWRRDPSLPVSPALKREHLEAFRQQHLGGRPMILAGTSIGGTIAADYALAYPQAVQKLILICAQGFISGVSPLPRPLAILGVQVLSMVWLRDKANQMAYVDKAKFATEDAWRIGRLSTHLPGWLEANVAFIQSGGFNMSEERIKQLSPPVLLLWGEGDEILSPTLATKWQTALGPSRCTFNWIPSSGHSPHLEQSQVVIQHMLKFLAADQKDRNVKPEVAVMTAEEPAVQKEEVVATGVLVA